MNPEDEEGEEPIRPLHGKGWYENPENQNKESRDGGIEKNPVKRGFPTGGKKKEDTSHLTGEQLPKRGETSQ